MPAQHQTQPMKDIAMSPTPSARTAKRRRRSTAFTLVEMMVAVALSIFMLTLFTQLFLGASNAITESRGITEIDQRMRGTFTTIRDDLSHIYLADAQGRELKPSELFAPVGTPSIPDQGYLLIEENSPSSVYPDASGGYGTSAFSGKPNLGLGFRQGIDQNRLSVEVDVNDVMAFTVQRPGREPSDFYWGRVPQASVSDSTPASSSSPLDTWAFAPPASNDVQGDGRLASAIAEVVYFLRPNNQQYELQDINDPPYSQQSTRSPLYPPRPALYTLYRRQLLVLGEGLARKFESLGSYPTSPSSYMGGGNSYFNEYDVSVRYDYQYNRLRFNTLQSLALRHNRYGMIPVGSGKDANGNPTRELPFSQGGLWYSSGIHVMLHDPSSSAPSGWLGRPTQRESTSKAFATDFPNLVMADSTSASGGVPDGIADRYSDTTGRIGDDVLLTNVVSFNVKVFDDDSHQVNRRYQRNTIKYIDLNGVVKSFPPYTQQNVSSGVNSYLSSSELPPQDNPLNVLPRSEVDNEENTAMDTDNLYRYRSPFRVPNIRDWPADVTGWDAFPYAIPGARNGMNFSVSIEAPFVSPSPFLTTESKDSGGSWMTPDVRFQPDFVDIGYRGVLGNSGSWTKENRESMKTYNLDLNPSNPYKFDVGWHTPARWRSTGRSSASYGTDSVPFSSSYDPVCTYDSWSAQYNWRDSSLPYFRPPPYERPIRGLEINIRVYEPRSQLTRDFRIVHAFR